MCKLISRSISLHIPDKGNLTQEFNQDFVQPL